MLGHLEEGLLDAGALHSTRLIEEHVVVVAGPRLSLLRGHLSLRLQVQLVTDAHEGERLGILWASILIEAISPAGERIEGLLVGDVVDEGAAVSSAIKGVTQRLELLLAGCIPNLQCHDCAID